MRRSAGPAAVAAWWSGRWMRRARRSRAATAGVQRQYLGCAGKVANGINTAHLAYVREHAGHALIGARQWIPRAQIEDPARSAAMGLPPALAFRTKGQLAIGIAAEALADGVRFDFFCGDESTAAAPSCGSSSRPAARPTCCGCRGTSAWPCPAGAG
jgi:DDE superfamily endonuclease